MGNTLGPRPTYQYTTDSGRNIRFRQDEDLATAVGNTASTSGPLQQLPINGAYIAPRVVYAVQSSDDSVRKTIVVGEANNSIFDTDNSQTITIDGEQFTTTGRRGERQQFGGGTPAEPD